MAKQPGQLVQYNNNNCDEILLHVFILIKTIKHQKFEKQE